MATTPMCRPTGTRAPSRCRPGSTKPCSCPGRCGVIPGAHTRAHTQALSAKFESWLAPKAPWLLDKVPERRREMLLSAIIAVEMTVETVEGAFKLNQHKPDEDHVAIATALSRQDDPSSRAIAERMVALRPQLNYDQHTPSLAQAGSAALVG